MRASRRELLAGGATALFSSAARLAPAESITPEQFGARGDGRTNDTDAFAAMTDFVNRRGGGTVVLRRTIYVVGRQLPPPQQGYAFAPAPIMDFENCREPLVIRGNGATLKCEAGLRYGTFDPQTGRPTDNKLPFTRPRERASPYRAMIRVEDCSGPVEISDLELDGNLQHLRIGGKYGDTGWQVPGTGIQLVNNPGPERLSRIHSHHHPLDGLLIDGLEQRDAVTRLDAVVCEYNGRQGCSITGGRGHTFTGCSFKNTGKAGLASAPGAGVDIEAEGGKTVRDLHFSACDFTGNKGVGMVADSGDSEGAVFEDCTFVGSTSWAAWPKKPRFRFTRCTFVGPIVNAYGDPVRERAAQFHDCSFRDDPALSPTGEIYGGVNPRRPIADLSKSENVLFNRCRFILTHRSVLPWVTRLVIFSDCQMSQEAVPKSFPRGTFIGRNVLSGNIGLEGARILGEVFLNGRKLPLTRPRGSRA